MSVGLLFECDDEVTRWFSATSYCKKACIYDKAVGILTDGKLSGAVLFHNWNGPNVEISYYGEKTMTLGVIRCIARYVLAQFDAARLTAITSKRNRQFMRALQKLGFRLEGTQRCYYGKNDCNRNTGVRFVAFREAIERVAKTDKKGKSQCL